MRGTIVAIAALLVGAIASSCAEQITVEPRECSIVLPEAADAVTTAAAEDLQRHVRLITGAEVAIGVEPLDGAYQFVVGSLTPGDDRPLAPEEARWTVTAEATYLFGDAERSSTTQFAVSAFLEDQLGVRWIAPGDDGASWTPSESLTLTTGEFSWAPRLLARGIRPGVRMKRYPQPTSAIEEFWSFARDNEAHDQYATDVLAWRRHMRMGSHSPLSYGHAFTDWWDRFSETHPEYFALNQWGKREPELRVDPGDTTPEFTRHDRECVKLCVSNPAVAEQIVADWVEGGMASKWVNVCENDLRWGLCRCPECVKLDVPVEGEVFDEHLTDRYVYLTNAVARLAREHDPEAGAVMYAYEFSEGPPRRERLEPNVAVGMVPTTVDLDELGAYYEAWADAGATMTFTRPNLTLYYETMAIPIGLERRMFDVLQLAVEHGAIAADYDSLTGMWPVCGMSNYILARAMSDPEKPFEYWEDHYCAAFGSAAEDVKRYFRFWREDVWGARLLPDLGDLITQGKYYNFARGVMWSLGDYYRAEDFDRAAAILQEAAARDLPEPQRRQLDQLILTNEHARLTFQAITQRGLERFTHSKALLDFRNLHRDDLQLSWISLFATETRFGDITALKTAERLKDYPLPWAQTALAWRFKLDPDEVGLDEKWQELPYAEMTDWELMRTDFLWENPYKNSPYPSDELRARLKDYDGIGWYATEQSIPEELAGREIYLYFGAVDESCWVYVNGQLAGEHLFDQPNDWNTPFEIRIDPFLDPAGGRQRFTVRVEDRSGAGGIWKRVWMVSHMP